MKFILIPVKDLSYANKRLSSVLNQEKRTELAYTMLEEVLTAVNNSKLADKRVVVTLDKKAIKMALNRGFEVIEEEKQKGESFSVDGAIQVCKIMGAKSVLVIPGDAPLLTGEDLDSILEKETENNCVILVPSIDELGTNAILRKPPDAIASHFGYDSFRKHIDEANKKGIHYETYENLNISIDIDSPEDIKQFSAYGTHTQTYKKLVVFGLINKNVEKAS